jgi:hypothetical protein
MELAFVESKPGTDELHLKTPRADFGGSGLLF